MSATPKKADGKKETLKEFEHRLKIEAKELSLAHRDVKPVRFICSNFTKIIKSGSM